jgi:hypothetical protein
MKRRLARVFRTCRPGAEAPQDELRKLSEIGALNFIQEIHRRAALWDSELAVRPRGELFEQNDPPSALGRNDPVVLV